MISQWLISLRFGFSFLRPAALPIIPSFPAWLCFGSRTLDSKRRPSTAPSTKRTTGAAVPAPAPAPAPHRTALPKEKYKQPAAWRYEVHTSTSAPKPPHHPFALPALLIPFSVFSTLLHFLPLLSISPNYTLFPKPTQLPKSSKMATEVSFILLHFPQAPVPSALSWLSSVLVLARHPHFQANGDHDFFPRIGHAALEARNHLYGLLSMHTRHLRFLYQRSPIC